MRSYRSLAHNVQTRAALKRFEDALETVSIVMRSATHQLRSDEVAILKRTLAAELRQVLSEAKSTGRHDGKLLVDGVALYLEIDWLDARNRCLIVLDELNSELSPWDDLKAQEILTELSQLAREAPAPIVTPKAVA